MRVNSKFRVLGWMAIASFLSACGGGGDDTVVFTPPDTSQPPPAAKSIEGGGVISRFGVNFSSVTLNAKTFDTTSPDLVVTIDGQASSIDQLDIGDVISIQATTEDDGETSIASSIDSDSVVEGPIQSIDLGNDTFVVLNQTIRVQAGTLFDDDIQPRSLEGLNVGDFVEVQGLIDANGDIAASRIEREDGIDDELELFGVIENLDTVAMTFTINGQVVDYSNAVLEGFPGSEPMDGNLVEVEGDMTGANGELIATEVELEDDDFDGEDGDLAELEGFITRFVSATDFDVNGFPVTTDDETVFEDGVVGDLALNIRIEVEGEIDMNGVLVADRVEFEEDEEEASIEIEAPIDSIDTANETIVLLGIPVVVESDTLVVDQSDDDDDSLSLDSLNVGDFVSIEGFEDPDVAGTVIAVSLEREDPETEVSIQGFIESITQPGFTILGVTIQTDANTEFEDDDDLPLTAAEFFNVITVGTLVEAEGTANGNTILADEVELED